MQAGAVSHTAPAQVSVAEPKGPRTVTATPAWLQGVQGATGVPPGKPSWFVTTSVLTLLSGSWFWTVNWHWNMEPGGTGAGPGHVFVIPRPVVTRGRLVEAVLAPEEAPWMAAGEEEEAAPPDMAGNAFTLPGR